MSRGCFSGKKWFRGGQLACHEEGMRQAAEDMGIWPLGSYSEVSMVPRDWDLALDPVEVGGSQGSRPLDHGVQFSWSHAWSCWVRTLGEDLVPGNITPKL